MAVVVVEVVGTGRPVGEMSLIVTWMVSSVNEVLSLQIEKTTQ
jgi:hypothetical protein